jgi:hypothetical protein
MRGTNGTISTAGNGTTTANTTGTTAAVEGGRIITKSSS